MTSLVFFGSSEYSLIILEKILNSPEFDLKLVVTKTDKPFGREKTITPNPVAKFAIDHQLPLLQLSSFTVDSRLKIEDCQADLGLCVAFGPPFFDQQALTLFPKGIINIHPSPLPKYRGATPGPWQIINGEKISAVTFFEIDLLPDHGPIITQIPIEIASNETADSFYKKAFSLAADNLDGLLKKERVTQDESQKSYFPKLDKSKAKIDWSWDNLKIERFVRAMFPWPIAWTEVKNQKNQIFKMKIFSYRSEPVKVQIEGKNITNWTEISSYYSIVK